MENLVQFKSSFMNDSCSKWNLADDVELLKHLERFSEVIIKKATIAEKCMDSLEESLTLTYLKVKNVSNEFHSVGNNQFVENRAHDEDETIKENEHEKKNLSDYAEDPPIINAKLDESISTCIRLLEDKFETIQLSESDSDDEGLEHSQVVLKPRKCYVERPLPHVIGSYKFLNDSTLGLSLILQEHEDSTETEDESTNLMTRINVEESTHPPQAEQFSESISLSRKSQDDSVSSYEVINGNDLYQGKQSIFRSSTFQSEQHFNDEDDDFESIVSGTNFSQSKTTAASTEGFIPKETIRPSEINITDSSVADGKSYSKEAMKSVLEQIYSSPPQENLFAKNKSKADHMDPVGGRESERNEYEEIEKSGTASQKSPSLGNIKQFAKKDVSPKLNPSSKAQAVKVEDDVLPNVPTKTLRSLSKNRARNQNKRPPSRKKRDESSNSRKSTTDSVLPHLPDTDFEVEPVKNTIEEVRPVVIQTPNTNLLSPSTDEEDLFTVGASGIPSDHSSDRLFQPFTYTQTFQNSKLSSKQAELPNQPEKQKTSFWDPFSEDDDTSFFQSSKSWSSQKLSKRSEQLLSGLARTPSDENLFTQTQDQSKPSLFDKPLKAKAKSSEISLFDDPDDDSLFCTTSDKRPSGLSEEPSTGLEAEPSSSQALFKSKTDFLSDPLGFSQDCDNE